MADKRRRRPRAPHSLSQGQQRDLAVRRQPRRLGHSGNQRRGLGQANGTGNAAIGTHARSIEPQPRSRYSNLPRRTIACAPMPALTDLALPVLRALPPEAAHRASLLALKALPRRAVAADPTVLAVKPWDRVFPNPVGLAAGYDKNAEAIDPLFGFGFGFVEIGTVTPLPQPGNPKPRVFRLSQDGAVTPRLRARDRTRGVVGVNIGRNKETHDPLTDYDAGVTALAPYADYLT